MPEDSSRISALLAGEVDFITVFPPSEIARLNESGDITADGVPSTRFMFVKFNTLRPPFQGNPKLWQALNYAIDNKLIIDSRWSEIGRASCRERVCQYV